VADDNEEEIRIGADITELKSQLRAAQDELRSFNKEVERANQMIQASGGQATGNNSLLKIYQEQAEAAKTKIVALTNSLAQAKTALAQLEQGSSLTFTSLQQNIDKVNRLDTTINSAASSAKAFTTNMGAMAATDETLRAVGAAAGGAEGGMRKLNFATAGVTREIIVLGHEVVSGNFSRIPGSMMVLGERVGGLTLGTFGLAAAFAAMVLGIGYGVYKILEFEKEIDHLQEGFALTGRGAEYTSSAIRYQISFMDELRGVSKKAAEELMHFAAENATISFELINQTSQLLPAFIKMYGEKAPQAVGKLTDTLSDLTLEGFQKLDHELLNLPADQYAIIENMIKMGEKAQAVEMILHTLATNGGVYMKSLGDQVYDTTKKMEDMEAVRAAGGDASVWASQEIIRLKESLRLLEEKRKAVGKQGAEAQYKREHDELVRLNDRLDKHGTITKRITELKRHLNEAAGRGDQKEVDLTNAGIGEEEKKLAALELTQNEKIYNNFVKQQEAKAAAFKSGSSQRISIAQEEADRALAIFGSESNQYSDAIRKVNEQRRVAAENAARDRQRQDKLDNADAIQDASAATRAIVQDQTLTSQRKLELAHEVWEALKKGEKLTQQELLRIRREMGNQDLEIERQRVALLRQIRTEELSTSLQVSRMTLAEKRASLDTEVAFFRITKNQKSQLLRQYIQEEYRAEVANIQRLMALDGVTLAEKTRYQQQIILLKQRERTALAQLNRQESMDAIQSWKQTLQPIQQATISMFSTMGAAGQSFGKTMRIIAGNTVDSFVAARIKIEFDWLAGQLAMAFGSQDGAEKSLLAWIATQLGIETASDVSNANKVASDETAALATMAISKTTSAGKIMDEAAVAAAATFASIAAIPIVGPELAPAAAAASYGTVAAMTSLLAVPLAVGAYDVPQDMLAQIHEGEMVVPKTFAAGLRGENSGAFGGQGGGDVHVNFSPVFQSIDPVSGAKYMQSMMPTIAKQLKSYLKYNSSLVPHK
jgi:hypothetical protein